MGEFLKIILKCDCSTMDTGRNEVAIMVAFFLSF